MQIFLSKLRRLGKQNLVGHSVAFPETLEKLFADNGIVAERGSGNLAAFLEVSAMVVIGLFTNPELAKQAILRLVEVKPNMVDVISQLAENCEDLAKRLCDSVE